MCQQPLLLVDIVESLVSHSSLTNQPSPPGDLYCSFSVLFSQTAQSKGSPMVAPYALTSVFTTGV